MKRDIPYGVINWENLVRDCYVVDNTGYIRELERCKTPVFLRPKRFGKSIVCSMLEVNFFRTTFASRIWDVLPMYYSVETEYNTPEGRCDFLAIPKPGFAKPACLIEFKHFKANEVKKGKLLGRATPDEETVAQAKHYRESLPRRPGWRSEIVTYVVEICSRRGHNGFEIA